MRKNVVKHLTIALAEQNSALIEQNQILESRLQDVQDDIDVLVRSGRWLIWHADVAETEPGFANDWRFRSDYAEAALSWLPIAVDDNQDFSTAITCARPPEDSEICHVNCSNALYGGLPGYSQEFRVRTRTGDIRWLTETVAVEHVSPTQWRLTGIAIDITESKQVEQELELMRREVMSQNAELQDAQAELEAQNDELARANARLESLATTDGLTGLKNHRAFQEALEHEWRGAQRHGAPLSLIFLDIDYFKNYNDAYGHPAGDEVLKQVGILLMEGARDIDCVARYGGEEFVVLAPRTDAEGVFALAERFRRRIAAASFPHRKITASFGVATQRATFGDAKVLIQTADAGLYAAKAQGRNCVSLAITEAAA